jgi:hypothetical protein
MDRFVTGVPLVLAYLVSKGGTAGLPAIRQMLSEEASEAIAEFSGQVMSECLARGLVERPGRATYVLTARGQATLNLLPEIEQMIQDETKKVKRQRLG